MGTLIRVLPGIYHAEPSDLPALVGQATNFWIFFPVAAALKQKIVQKVMNTPVPEHSRQTPVFRAGVVDPSTGKVGTWWLWDGEREWKIGGLTDEQRKLPIRGAWNDTMLVERIEAGWLPEKDDR
ncbi:hypothetical protein M1D55_01370 [Cupriavidus sp. JZ107]